MTTKPNKPSVQSANRRTRRLAEAWSRSDRMDLRLYLSPQREGLPGKLVIDAGANQIFGERHRAADVIGRAERTLRTANRAQIHVQVLDLGADRVGEEVFDAGACRPAERRRWMVASARGLRADREVAHGAARRSHKGGSGTKCASIWARLAVRRVRFAPPITSPARCRSPKIWFALASITSSAGNPLGHGALAWVRERTTTF